MDRGRPSQRLLRTLFLRYITVGITVLEPFSKVGLSPAEVIAVVGVSWSVAGSQEIFSAKSIQIRRDYVSMT